MHERTNTYESVKERLKYLSPTFPKQLQAAADYVLENEKEVALNTVRQVANEANVTTSTMVRLATTLGFENYSEFREVFKKEIIEAPTSSFQEKAFKLLNNKMKRYDDTEVSVLRATSQAFNDDAIRTIPLATKTLLKAKRIFVFGMRDLFSCAFHFCYLMRIVYPNSYLIRAQEGMLFDEITHFKRQDVVVVFGSSPHSREMIEFFNIITASDAKIISVTDNFTSKIASDADIVFALGQETLNFFPSILPYIALGEMLVTEFVTLGGQSILENIDTFEKRQKEFNIYA